jgi:LEA14-like dessication related protein
LPPDVTLVDLELVDATIFESTFDIRVRVFNENPEPLVIDGAVITLELEGRRFGKGSTDERVEVPRLGSAVLGLDMHLSHVAVASKIRGVLDRRTVSYSITGKVYVVTPSGAIRRLSIDKRGSIDLADREAESTGLPNGGA